MKTIRLILAIFIIGAITSLESCGPVIVSSGPSYSTPPWFYPNRVLNLRYIYFPDYMVYYDLSLGNYIYFNNGIWLTVKVLPQRFNTINLKRAKRVRVNNYFGNNIAEFHRRNNVHIKSRRNDNDNESKTRRRRY